LRRSLHSSKKIIFNQKIRLSLSIFLTPNRHTSGGWEMTMDDVVVDVSQDWVLACDVQQRFMQGLGRTSDSADYSARCRQVRALGGDCYDFMPLTNDRLALVVGDASGKGVAAALMIASVQSSLRTAALFTGNDLATLLKIVNLQAGHTPPIVFRRNGSIDTLETGGAPVGMFPDSSYDEGAVQLDPGDVVITYTDGVIEAANQSGEEWGVQRLLKSTAAWARLGTENAEQLVRSIFNSMDGFSRGCQTDDATLAVLRVL
jgi:phosphoserine phosphatase RsbU/P